MTKEDWDALSNELKKAIEINEQMAQDYNDLLLQLDTLMIEIERLEELVTKGEL